MITKLAKSTAYFFSANKLIETGEEDIYAYGMELLYSTVLNLLIALAIAVVSGELLACAVFLAAFVTIRVYAGGYHADTHWGCMLILAVVEILFIIFIKNISAVVFTAVIPILWIISMILILCFAPVAHPNKPIPEKRKGKLRRKAVIAAVFWTVFSAVLLLFLPKISLCAVMGMFTISCAALAEKLKVGREAEL